jgi:hypothetical protein
MRAEKATPQRGQIDPNAWQGSSWLTPIQMEGGQMPLKRSRNPQRHGHQVLFFLLQLSHPLVF